MQSAQLVRESLEELRSLLDAGSTRRPVSLCAAVRPVSPLSYPLPLLPAEDTRDGGGAAAAAAKLARYQHAADYAARSAPPPLPRSAPAAEAPLSDAAPRARAVQAQLLPQQLPREPPRAAPPPAAPSTGAQLSSRAERFTADWTSEEAALVASIRALAVPPPRHNPSLLSALEGVTRRHVGALYRAALALAADAAAITARARRDTPSLAETAVARAALAERNAALAERDAAREDAQHAEQLLRDAHRRIAQLMLAEATHVSSSRRSSSPLGARASAGRAVSPPARWQDGGPPSWLLLLPQHSRVAAEASGGVQRDARTVMPVHLRDRVQAPPPARRPRHVSPATPSVHSAPTPGAARSGLSGAPGRLRSSSPAEVSSRVAVVRELRRAGARSPAREWTSSLRSDSAAHVREHSAAFMPYARAALPQTR